MDEAPTHWAENSQTYKSMAQPIIEALENGEDVATFPALQSDLDKINKATRQLNEEVKNKVLSWIKKGKRVLLLGGDHSTPLGYYQALAEQHNDFGILHFRSEEHTSELQ